MSATLWDIIESNYVIKVGVEVALTPITYLVVRYLKRVEHSDLHDRNTDFNLFQLSSGQAPGQLMDGWRG